MRSTARLAALASGAVIAIAPAAAFAAGHGSEGMAKPSTEPSHHTMPSDAKAFGVLCQGESKHHMKGEKGTAFSRCVTDMAKLNKGEAKSPAEACANERADHRMGDKRLTGDKRAKGDKRATGDAFSRCVAAGEKLLSEKAAGGFRK